MKYVFHMYKIKPVSNVKNFNPNLSGPNDDWPNFHRNGNLTADRDFILFPASLSYLQPLTRRTKMWMASKTTTEKERRWEFQQWETSRMNLFWDVESHNEKLIGKEMAKGIGVSRNGKEILENRSFKEDLDLLGLSESIYVYAYEKYFFFFLTVCPCLKM